MRRISYKAKRIIRIVCTFLCRLFGRLEDVVLFISFEGRYYSDNPKAVSEKLHELFPDIKIKWIIDPKKTEILPSYVIPVDKNNFIACSKAYATSKVILTNFGFPMIAKSRKQFFIQTWHGDKAFKKILCDSPFVSSYESLPESRKGFCDLCVAGSDYGERKFRTAFKYPGDILNIGTPRNDLLVLPNQKLIADIKKKLSISETTKILLYAPTLRREAADNNKVGKIDIGKTLELLEKKYECPWVCFMRSHPGVNGLIDADYNNKMINLSKYEDMADLLLISDMLITDYSSCAGDFALVKRPLILFQADREEYILKDRTFYFDIKESPYWVAETQDELEQIILKMTDDSIRENCQAVLDFYGNTEEGYASKAIAEIIAEKILPTYHIES